MSRPLRAVISVAALSRNLALARCRAGGARVWAVMKANAYGHGLKSACAGFHAADGWALLEWDWAQALRRQFPRRRLLMLEGAFSANDTREAALTGLDLVVHEPRQVEWIRSLRDVPRALRVLVKFDSGMNRLGFGARELRDAHEALRDAPAVAEVGLMTHFANADLPGGTSDALLRFERAAGLLPGPRSLCNSAALLAGVAAGAAWVRPGIMLYGASPARGTPATSLGLQPAMRLESRLIAARQLRPGDAVGYGSGFVADRAMRIGVVACGYADGYPRHAPTGTPVLVDGVRTRLVGRVSMDMLTVDLEPVPSAQPGSPVVLWGDAPTVDEVAECAGTIGYELLCAIARRVAVEVEPADAQTGPCDGQAGPCDGQETG